MDILLLNYSNFIISIILWETRQYVYYQTTMLSIKLPIYRLVNINSIQWSFTLGHTFINNTCVHFLQSVFSDFWTWGIYYLLTPKNIYKIFLWNESEICSVILTLCYPMNYTVHGILQARVLEWVAFPFSRGSSQPRDWTQVSSLQRFFTNWATGEAQEYWNR